MNPLETMSRLSVPMPGRLRQVAYVLPDLEVGVQGWLALGVGPWFVIRNIRSRNIYRGAKQAVTFSTAFANVGPLQLEIIQPEDDEPSIFREFLDAGRQGLHHLAWWTADYRQTVAQAEAAGLRAAFTDDGLAARYTYFDSPFPALATALEVVEITERNRGLFDKIRAASENWRPGDRPIHRIPAALLGMQQARSPQRDNARPDAPADAAGGSAAWR